MHVAELVLWPFLEEAPFASAMFDREMRYLHASQGWRKDYGLGDRVLRGASHYEIFPEIPERWKQIHRLALTGEFQQSEEDRFERADGSVQWLRWQIRPWFQSNGEIGGIVICTEDITERKRIEEELRIAKARLTEEKLYLEEEIADQGGFGEIIGWDTGLKTVIDKVRSVARTDSTVLLLGETGTGKELIARSIHKQSRRARQTLHQAELCGDSLWPSGK